MKRLILTNEAQSKLLQDEINRKIVKVLVQNELSVSDISRELDLPVVKTWRRVKMLEKQGIIQRTNSKMVSNLEKKMFRATAVRYTRNDAFDLKPQNSSIFQSYQKFRQIQLDMMRLIQNMNEVPSSVNPIDYALAVDLYAACTVYLKNETQSRMRAILKDVAEARLF